MVLVAPLATLAGGLVACSARPASAPAPAAGSCILIAPPTVGVVPDTLTAVVRADFRAERVAAPLTEGERVVAAQLADGTAPTCGASRGSGSRLRVDGNTVTLISPTQPTLIFAAAAGDVRDRLDAGVDLLLTRDRDVVSYAATGGRYRAVALPWSETYLFAGPPPVPPAALDSLRAELAHDAVQADARPAAEACGDSMSGAAPRVPGRIVYPVDDTTANDLAARLVALGISGRAFGGVALRADAVPLEYALAALDSHREFGVVVGVPRGSVGRFCASGATALVDVRTWALVRADRVGLAVDADGTPRLVVRRP